RAEVSRRAKSDDEDLVPARDRRDRAGSRAGGNRADGGLRLARCRAARAAQAALPAADVGPAPRRQSVHAGPRAPGTDALLRSALVRLEFHLVRDLPQPRLLLGGPAPARPRARHEAPPPPASHD